MTEARDSTDVSAPAERRALRSAAALLPPIVALLVQLALGSFLRPSVWFLFYPAVFFSSWIGGLSAAIVASAVGAASVLWFFLLPLHSFAKSPGEYLAAGVFFATGVAFGVFHDRLRRANRRASRALAASEQVNASLKKANDERRIFGALIENSSDFIGIADPDGRPVYVNPAGRRMVGLTADQAIENTSIPEYYPPAQRGFATEVILKSMIEKGHFQGETFFRNWQTEEPIPVSDTHFMVPDPETGQVLGMATITRDISDLRRLQDALRSSHEDLSRAQSVARVGSWRLDVRRNELRWSDENYRIFGVTPGTPMTYESFLACVHPDDRAFVDREWTGALRGEPYDIEHRIVAGGTIKWIREKADLEFDEHHALVGGIGIAQDITERRRLEEELRAAEREQKLLAEVGATFAATLDYEETLNTIAQLAVRDLSDFCIVDVAINGETRRQKVVSRDPARAWICDLLTHISIDRSRPHITRATLETHRSVLMEHVSPEMVRALSQSEVHLRALRTLDPRSVMVVPLLVHGKLGGALAFVSSTTSRVYGRSDLRLAEELALRAALAIENARLYRMATQAIQARDELAGVIAHDLRNPLGNILMQARLLRQAGGEPDERARRPAEAIERAASRMNHLIQDLLDVTRMDAGQLPIERGCISAAELVSDSAEAQKTLASSASLELRSDVAETLPDVWGDQHRLLQVFENLVGNAARFTEPGGCIAIGATPRNGEVLFWVSDTGAGIDPDDLPHVFDRFWQAGEAGRTGAGLGLAIVKGIVEAHGGRVWVESMLGRGSTFFFTIPTAPQPEQRWPEAARSGEAPR